MHDNPAEKVERVLTLHEAVLLCGEQLGEQSSNGCHLERSRLKELDVREQPG